MQFIAGGKDSSPEIPLLRSCCLGFKGRGKLLIEVKDGEYTRYDKGHKAHAHEMFENHLTVARRILLGKILGPAVEVYCRNKMGEGFYSAQEK